MCRPHLALKFSLQVTEKQEESVKCHVLVLVPHSERARMSLYTKLCLASHRQKTKTGTNKMKTNQSLHHLEHLSSIHLQSLWFVKIYCGDKTHSITLHKCGYNPLCNDIIQISQINYSFTFFDFPFYFTITTLLKLFLLNIT